MGINAIGSGTFTITNSTILGRSLINLRPDYGSTWHGELIIQNCVFKPTARKLSNVSLISGRHTGLHDFGYVCYMPERITIEHLKNDVSNVPEGDQCTANFADFHPPIINDSNTKAFPSIK